MVILQCIQGGVCKKGRQSREHQEDDLRLLPPSLTPQVWSHTAATAGEPRTGAEHGWSIAAQPTGRQSRGPEQAIGPQGMGCSSLPQPSVHSAKTNLDWSWHSRSRNEEQHCFLILSTDKATKRNQGKKWPS